MAASLTSRILLRRVFSTLKPSCLFIQRSRYFATTTQRPDIVDPSTCIESESEAYQVNRGGTSGYAPRIPSFIQSNLAELFRSCSIQQLSRDHEAFLSSYGNPGAVYGWKQAMAYTGFKMVPALGVIQRVLYETSQQLEEFYPESMLDFGSGPGTCVAACADKWPRLSEAITIEPSRSMADICSRLLERGPGSSLRVRRALSLPEYVGHVAKEDLPKFDVVTASYTFSELPSESARLVALSMLWEMVAHEGVLVLVESATSHGIDVVAQARRALVEDGLRYDTVFGSSQEVEDAADAVRVIAPCTHSLPCPMLHKKYPEGRFKTGCHFLQRTERLLTNPSSKGSGVGRRAQTERYSYLVLQKIANGVSAGSSSGRILRRPLLAKRQVILDLCQGDGRLERKTATKANSGSEVYRRARKASWGNVWST